MTPGILLSPWWFSLTRLATLISVEVRFMCLEDSLCENVDTTFCRFDSRISRWILLSLIELAFFQFLQMRGKKVLDIRCHFLFQLRPVFLSLHTHKFHESL
jgi:hypothetical protein